MRNRLLAVALVVSAAVVIGCAGTPPSPYATDATVARRVLDAICNGSSAPIQPYLHPDQARQLPVKTVQTAGKALNASFGSVTGLRMVSTKDVMAYDAAPPGTRARRHAVSETIWQVNGTRGSYQMELRFLGTQLTGIAFRSKPSLPFQSVSLLAAEYHRQTGK